MKKFVNLMFFIKSNACLAFTGAMALYTFASALFGLTAMTFSMIWQFMVISFLISTLQYIFFGYDIIKNMKYISRIFCFTLPTYAIISAFALIFKWFPTAEISSWLIFTAIFFAVEIVVSIVFSIIFKLSGLKYTEQLSKYQGKNV